MRKIIISLFAVFAASASLWGQDGLVTLHVVDGKGQPVRNAEVLAPEMSAPLTTDGSGTVRFYAAEGSQIEISVYNTYYRRVRVSGETMTVPLEDRHRVFSLGYGAAVNKEGSSQALSGAARADFGESSQTQIMNALYGLIPGLAVRQNGTGAWPSDCDPSLSVRGIGSFSGNSVLVLVDGVPREPSTVDIDEVESVSVLKDAASLAIYGIRGADGAVLITTRRGGNHKLNLKAEYSFGVQTPFRMAQMASPLEYANALNEARSNDGLSSWFSASDIASIADGISSVIPTADWNSRIFRRAGFNNEAKLTMDGSGKRIRYFVYAGYNSNRGFYKNTGLLEGVDNQYAYDALKLRTNLDVDVTSSTKVLVNLAASIRQLSGPQSRSIQSYYTAPSVGFPVMYNDIWARTTKFSNPVQDILGTAGRVTFSRSLSADLAIRQDLSMLVKGLSAEVRAAYDNSSDVNDDRSFGSVYYSFSPLYDAEGNISDYEVSQYGNATEMSFATYLSSQYMRMAVWAKLGWNRSFGEHHIDAAFLFNRDKKSLTGANNSFSHHDYILTASYNYADRYLATLTATASGSSLMPSGDKFRFYPAASLGWVISNEDFLKDSDIVNFLKLRGSYGLVGMDSFLSYDMDIQFNGTGRSYIFVQPTVTNGATEGSLPSTGVQPELDSKADIGLDFTFFKGLSGEIDAFYNRRQYIRTKATGTVSEVIGIGASDTFNGRTTNYGVDAALGWNQTIGDISYFLKGTVSFARNRIDRIDETYQPYAYLCQQGGQIGRFYGLVADGFYQEEDFDTSGNLLPILPENTFASVQPGDVKYRDLNGDGKIDNYDRCYQLTAELPEVYYGFSFGLEWKGLGFSALFQGVGNSTLETTLSSIYQPLYGGDKNISKHYLESYWSENRTTGVKYPRLTSLDNRNNYLASSLWTENGAFLKLRELEIYYDLPRKALEKMKMDGMRVYLRGNNLFSVDHIRILDPEVVNFNYPTARTVSVGLKVNF